METSGTWNVPLYRQTWNILGSVSDLYISQGRSNKVKSASVCIYFILLVQEHSVHRVYALGVNVNIVSGSQGSFAGSNWCLKETRIMNKDSMLNDDRLQRSMYLLLKLKNVRV